MAVMAPKVHKHVLHEKHLRPILRREQDIVQSNHSARMELVIRVIRLT